MLLNGSKAICITPRTFAEPYADKSQSIIKIAKPILAYDLMVYVAERDFPFAEIFYELFRRIHSSGLLKATINNSKLGYFIVKEEKNYVDDDFIPIIVFMTFCGYALSTMVFIAELFLKYIQLYSIRIFASLPKINIPNSV